MSATEDKFSLSLQLCVTWETERPTETRISRSPVFTFKNRDFYLELRLDAKWKTYDLYLILTKEQKSPPEFTVKTHFSHPGENTPLFCKRATYSSPKKFIAYIYISEVEKCIPDFKTKGILTIECAFEEVDISTQFFKSGEQQSVHFPLKADQNFSLESLSKDLEALLDNKTLPDVQLMVEETSVPCHRAVLVARSTVFAAMFLHKMTESASGVLEIKDMDLVTAEAFLKYLYSGKIPDDLTEERLMKLFDIGDKYKVNALKKVCWNEMMKNINDENCLSYLSLAEAHSDQEFKDAVVRFIVKDDRLLKSEDWIQFSSENHKLAIEVYRRYVEK